MAEQDEDRGLASWAAAGAMEDAGETAIAERPAEQPAPIETIPAVEAEAQAAEGEQDATVSEDQSQVEAAGEEGEQAAEEETAKPAEPSAKPKKQQPLPDWMKRRFAEQTAAQREAERRAQEASARAEVAEAALEAIRKRNPSAEGDPAPIDKQPAIPEGYVPRDAVHREAERIASEQKFNADADAAYYAGKQNYTDFDDALAPLQMLGIAGRRDFQEAALATEAAPDVLYHLGNNPDEASKILGFLKAGQHAKATAEMTKIAVTMKASKAATAKAKTVPSKAPAPIRPVGGSAIPSVDLDKMTDDDFTREFDNKARANGWY